MKIRYFADTDTALIEFSSLTCCRYKKKYRGTFILIWMKKGNLVSMTIEHAREGGYFWKFHFYMGEKSVEHLIQRMINCGSVSFFTPGPVSNVFRDYLLKTRKAISTKWQIQALTTFFDPKGFNYSHEEFTGIQYFKVKQACPFL